MRRSRALGAVVRRPRRPAAALRYLCTGVSERPDRPPHDYGVVIILLGVADRWCRRSGRAAAQGILAFLNASHLDMVDKPRRALEFERARKLSESLPEPARTFMSWVNNRDVGTSRPALLPTSRAGDDPALSAARNPPPSRPSTCCTAPTTT
jgi:hypothetical protein